MKTQFYLAIVLGLLLASCESARVPASWINENAFPPGIEDTSRILVLQKRTHGMNAKGMNNHLLRSFQKYYKGPVELATFEEIKSEAKFQDSTRYRFVVVDDAWGGTTSTRVGTSFNYSSNYSIDYRIYDIVTGKTHQRMGADATTPAKAQDKAAWILNRRITMKPSVAAR